MTLKELAHAAHQTLLACSGCDVRRSHVHELLAAAFGYNSWAAFAADALVADGGVGQMPDGAKPRIAGRAMQLQYGQGPAAAMADALDGFVAERRLGALRWSALNDLCGPAPRRREPEDLDDDASQDWLDDKPLRVEATAQERASERLLASPLLLSCLEAAATSLPSAHHVLAALHRCSKPNSYLYEESLKGRVLNAVEKDWVDEYLRREPQYRKYESHLRAAALGGIRAAALEYGTVFESSEFVALAERLSGDVDPEQMAAVATAPEKRAQWLRKAAEEGSQSALEQLAAQGDAWAEDRVAARADSDWLRRAAERAIELGSAVRAWTWQYFALKRGFDLTQSTMAAYHDGGSEDGQFYDSDFGGPMYVAGDEGLVLPSLSDAGHREAKAKAREISERRHEVRHRAGLDMEDVGHDLFPQGRR